LTVLQCQLNSSTDCTNVQSTKVCFMECDAAAALPGTASASGSAHAHVHLKPTAAVGKESHKETDRAFAFGPDPAALQPLIIEICAILAEVKRRLRMFAASVALSGAVSPAKPIAAQQSATDTAALSADCAF
jgi:hypothetical protein